MKWVAVLTAAMLVAGSEAGDGILGTRTGGVPSVSQGEAGALPFLQMLLAVLAVGVLLKFALPKLMAKFGGRLSARFDSEIKLRESASFAGGTLQIVEVRGKTLLLGITSQNVNLLSDLSDAKPAPAPLTFSEILEEAEPMQPAPADPNVAEALERLQRLTR